MVLSLTTGELLTNRTDNGPLRSSAVLTIIVALNVINYCTRPSQQNNGVKYTGYPPTVGISNGTVTVVGILLMALMDTVTT